MIDLAKARGLSMAAAQYAAFLNSDVRAQAMLRDLSTALPECLEEIEKLRDEVARLKEELREEVSAGLSAEAKSIAVEFMLARDKTLDFFRKRLELAEAVCEAAMTSQASPTKFLTLLKAWREAGGGG